jgi:hypothetical protein
MSGKPKENVEQKNDPRHYSGHYSFEIECRCNTFHCNKNVKVRKVLSVTTIFVNL